MGSYRSGFGGKWTVASGAREGNNGRYQVIGRRSGLGWRTAGPATAKLRQNLTHALQLAQLQHDDRVADIARQNLSMAEPLA
jgi:hypothetical protein